jgi:hypothetical protein
MVRFCFVPKGPITFILLVIPVLGKLFPIPVLPKVTGKLLVLVGKLFPIPVLPKGTGKLLILRVLANVL